MATLKIRWDVVTKSRPPTIIVDMSSNGPAYNVAAGNELYIHYGKFWGERDYEVSMDPAPHGTLGSDDYLPAMQKFCKCVGLTCDAVASCYGVLELTEQFYDSDAKRFMRQQLARNASCLSVPDCGLVVCAKPLACVPEHTVGSTFHYMSTGERSSLNYFCSTFHHNLYALCMS